MLCAFVVLVATAGAKAVFPETIPLPNGFRPEGISIGNGTTFYVGSIPTGAVYRGDLRTGEGSLLVAGVAGRAATGVEFDRGLLYVAPSTSPTRRGRSSTVSHAAQAVFQARPRKRSRSRATSSSRRGST